MTSLASIVSENSFSLQNTEIIFSNINTCFCSCEIRHDKHGGRQLFRTTGIFRNPTVGGVVSKQRNRRRTSQLGHQLSRRISSNDDLGGVHSKSYRNYQEGCQMSIMVVEGRIGRFPSSIRVLQYGYNKFRKTVELRGKSFSSKGRIHAYPLILFSSC